MGGTGSEGGRCFFAVASAPTFPPVSLLLSSAAGTGRKDGRPDQLPGALLQSGLHPRTRSNRILAHTLHPKTIPQKIHADLPAIGGGSAGLPSAILARSSSASRSSSTARISPSARRSALSLLVTWHTHKNQIP
jgi:hypothetical protein